LAWADYKNLFIIYNGLCLEDSVWWFYGGLRQIKIIFENKNVKKNPIPQKVNACKGLRGVDQKFCPAGLADQAQR
jgi:hypothetical protein